MPREKCPMCKGKGELLLRGQNFRKITCMRCKGRGYVVEAVAAR